MATFEHAENGRETKRDLTALGVDRGGSLSGLLPAAGIILVVVSAEVAMMTSFALRRVHRACNAT